MGSWILEGIRSCAFKKIGSLDFLYFLVNAFDIIGNSFAIFQFIGTLHEVPLLLGLAYFGAYYFVCYEQL